MAFEHLKVELNEEIKAKVEKAFTLLELKDLDEYIARLIDEDATQVIAAHETITLAANEFDNFLVTCEEAKSPNQALRDAVEFTTQFESSSAESADIS